MPTLASITVVELGKPAMDIIQQTVLFPRRKLRFTSRVSREFSLGILLIIMILVVPTFINAVQSAYSPTSIASASLPVRGAVPDWLEALSWMSNNLPHSSVVFAWWDYGYWITVNTGLSTLSDNGTGNTTAIQDIATGFMLNESLAVQLMRQERVTHVAIFISYNRGLCGSNDTAVTPHFFVQDFASSSSYVLLYSVRYPDTPSMTAQLTPAIVAPTGGNTSITGSLTTSTGKPVDTTTSKSPVILEYSSNQGSSWNFIANVNATAGHFSYAWTTKLPTGQPYVLVRARWQGDPAQLLDIAVTMTQPLTFM